MPQEIAFSVVVPTYNRVQLLARALDSIWQQRFNDYEVIVVDDGSQDGTKEFLRGLDHKVRVITQKNRGAGAARNVGMRAAKGGYVAFLDSDDLWFPWTLDTFTQAIRERDRPQILAGKYIEFTTENELLGVRESACLTEWFPDYLASSHQALSVGSGTCVLDRRALSEVQFLEDRLNSEDHDLILQMGTRPGFAQIISPNTVAWRRHTRSATADLANGVAGTLRLLDREASGVYPGGKCRLQERHRIIARHTRPIVLSCIRNGAIKEGLNLYRLTVFWNARLGHWKYCLAVPAMAAFARFTRLMMGSLLKGPR